MKSNSLAATRGLGAAAYKAAIFRQLWRWEEPHGSYETSLRFIFKRLEFQKRCFADDAARITQEATRASYEAAKVMALGIGFAHATRGFLREAHVDVLTALIMLASTGDVLRSAYAQLLLASIKRAEAGRDPAKLERALERLQAVMRSNNSSPRSRRWARLHRNPLPCSVLNPVDAQEGFRLMAKV